MACHASPPFTDDQVAWLDARFGAAVDQITLFASNGELTPAARDAVADAVRAAVRHCSICGTSPISRVVACTEVDCPAREAIAA